MPIHVDIRSKPPKFKGDSERHHAVVSGPREVFDARLDRWLELQGLAPLRRDRDSAIWSSRPAIGGPPLHVAAVLQAKYRARLSRLTAERLARAVGERPAEDGLERFFGGGGPATGGRAALRVEAGRRDFAANCDADDLERVGMLEAAGWLPVERPSPELAARFGTAPFRTRDPFMAGHLEPFMSPAARRLLAERMGEAHAKIRRSATQEAPPDFAVPVPEGLAYLPFQAAGIEAVVSEGGSALIADDMGLGKTIQAIGVMNATPGISDVLVICQANMRLKWAREIGLWRTDPGLEVGVAEGGSVPTAPVVVINYDILDRNLEALRARNWRLVVVDEAHSLKNPETKRTRAVLGDLLDADGARGLPLAADGRILMLTGTPRPNRVSEMWPLLTATRPDIWGRGPRAMRLFVNRYEPPVLIKRKIKLRGREIEKIVPLPGKPERETELQLRLRASGSFVRRLKRDTDLPPKFRTPLEIPVRLGREEKEMLRQAEVDLARIAGLFAAGEVTLGETRMAGAVIDVLPSLDPDTPRFEEMARVRRNLGLVKAPHCARFILDELEAETDMSPDIRPKTVVFAHHREVVDRLFEEAERRLPGAFRIYDGGLSGKRRQETVDLFQNDESVRGLIMTLAGATGITLTRSARMRVVEPDWSPSNMIQVEDRIWRIGQTRNVDIGYLFMAGTLDARIGAKLVEKMASDERTLNSLSFRHAVPEGVT